MSEQTSSLPSLSLPCWHLLSTEVPGSVSVMVLSWVPLLRSTVMIYSLLPLPIFSMHPSPYSVGILMPAMHETPYWSL